MMILRPGCLLRIVLGALPELRKAPFGTLSRYICLSRVCVHVARRSQDLPLQDVTVTRRR
jgi:hypothetical protein